MNYKHIALGTLAYFVSSFVIQGLLAVALAGDYFAKIPIMRNPPIIPLSLSQTIVSGIAFALLFPHTNFSGTPVIQGLKFGLLLGLVTVPFVALDLPARFMIPSIGTWIWVQGLLGILHYTVVGILIGLISGKDTQPI